MLIKCVSQQDTKHGGLTGNHVGGKCDGAQGMVADKKENIKKGQKLWHQRSSPFRFPIWRHLRWWTCSAANIKASVTCQLQTKLQSVINVTVFPFPPNAHQSVLIAREQMDIFPLSANASVFFNQPVKSTFLRRIARRRDRQSLCW